MRFTSIEPQVNDLVNLAQILGSIFEDVTPADTTPGSNMVMTATTYGKLSFLVGEFCGRTIKLERDFEAALAEDMKGVEQ